MTFGTGKGQKGASWVFTAPHDGHVPIAGELTSSVPRSGSAWGSVVWTTRLVPDDMRPSVPHLLITCLSPPSGSPNFSSMLQSLRKFAFPRAEHSAVFLCTGSNTITCTPFTAGKGQEHVTQNTRGGRRRAQSHQVNSISTAILQNSLSSERKAARACACPIPIYGQIRAHWAKVCCSLWRKV